jgi:hypothetical protein
MEPSDASAEIVEAAEGFDGLGKPNGFEVIFRNHYQKRFVDD